MKFRRYLYILTAIILATAAFSTVDSYGARKRNKAKTTQTTSKSKKSKKKSKSSGSSSKKKTKKKSSKSKKRTSSKPRTRRRITYTTPKVVEKPSNDSLTLAVNAAVLEWIPEQQNPGGLRVNKVAPSEAKRNVAVSLNENFTYMPVNRELINDLSRVVKKALPDSIRGYGVTLNVGQRPLSYYINRIDRLPEKYRQNVPFVTPVNPYIHPRKGMEGDIVALWHSHGRYFRGGGWQWQRGFLFQSLEDTYTMGYVLPFLVPMLENAGAYVMLPRERDYSRHEVIVDNDTNEGGLLFSQTTYKEQNGTAKWATGELEGFIYDLPDFRDTENPFENGTYRQAATVRSGGRPSVAAWYADIPEDGEYAVYVSYKTLPNSTTDAHYTVNYSGGSREFKVNQTMGGGTWIYLGTFPLEEGFSETTPVVTLTNVSDKGGETVVTADAIKIGGGMGNIARSSSRSDIYYDPSTPDKTESAAQTSKKDSSAVDDEGDEGEEDDGDVADDEDEGDESDEGDDEVADDETDEDVDAPPHNPDDVVREDPNAGTAPKSRTGRAPVFTTSGMPRYLEGARYWLHWAGFPEKVYSPFHGRDDYKDDYTCRGHWVNYLAGGSRVLPGHEGLNIPVDISFALHSDAGKRGDDSTVGTLGIYYTNGGAQYVDGTPRNNSRMMTDMLMRQITQDIRRTYEPRWTRRSMWDKSYLEARVAEVPTTLIEILSHQNFGDMQYGLDPNFRFVVSRAIYKAMARFVSERKGREVVIQPLPVHDFAIRRTKAGHFRLSWVATPDSLEPTANPHKYIVMERTEGTLGFHKVGETSSTHFDVKVSDDLIHSYKVIAANDGGVSFPSETLALRENKNGTPVLVINGFDRISGPSHFSADGRAGFNSEDDFGVPYINDASFAGYQTEFRRGAGNSFGHSNSAGVGVVIGGNTFDFPAVHGDAVADLGYGFVSCSAGAVEAGNVDLSGYKYVDLILGKQKRTIVGRGTSGVRYEAVPIPLQRKLASYVKDGGRLLVSGSFAVSDLFDSRSNEESREFAEDVLGVRIDSEASCTRSGKISVSTSSGNQTMEYSNNLNPDHYIVEKSDALLPAGEGRVIATFTDTGAAAGVASRFGKGSVTFYSIPLESLRNDADRLSIFKGFLKPGE